MRRYTLRKNNGLLIYLSGIAGNATKFHLFYSAHIFDAIKFSSKRRAQIAIEAYNLNDVTIVSVDT